LGIVALSVLALFSFAITAQADMTIHFTLLNSQQNDPNAAWWAGKSNMLFDHNNSGFPGEDDMVWDWWGYNKDFTGAGHYYFSEINFDCHDCLAGNCSTPNCSVEDYYFKGLPCGWIDRLREPDDARDSTFDLSLLGTGPDYTVDYGDTVEVYGWALVKAIMRHTSDFSFAEQGAQASGGTYDSDTNVLDAWVNINLDFINPISSTPTGMSPVDTQEAWVDGFGQKGFIIPKAEFTAWHNGGSPTPGKYMVPTYTLGIPPVEPSGIQYPDEYIETGLEDMGPWLDDLVDDNLGSVWSEIENADYLYIAFSRDNFVIDDGDYESVDSDGIAGNEGKTSAGGANLTSLHPEAWPILAKTFLNDEVVWIAAGHREIVEMPDLIISENFEEWIEPSDPSQGYKVNYTVKNRGNANATQSSNTCLFIDGASVESQSCPALAVGATHSDTFDGNFTCDGSDDNVTVCADCDSDVSESNEDNNCLDNKWSCFANLFDIGDGAGKPGDSDKKVGVSLTNAVDVAGIQVDICDVGDYLSLPNVNDVEPTDRAAGFTCDFEDNYGGTGCAKLILYSESGDVIAAGDGPILILHYDVDTGAQGSSVEITSENLFITDKNDYPLTAAEDPGNFSFLDFIYGDIWPYDETTGIVGDGEVNIFDVVRDVQISLGIYTPATCEFVAGDVPTGLGVDCQAPDGEINISDVLEMVARILGRSNCIDTY